MRLTTEPILQCADPTSSYGLSADASSTGAGAVLTKTDEINNIQVAYTSRKLYTSEQEYYTSERELLSIIHALITYRSFYMDKTLTC